MPRTNEQASFGVLPPTGQRILAAARRLLAREGFPALSLQGVADEAGEAKASVSRPPHLVGLIRPDGVPHSADAEDQRNEGEVPEA